MHDLLRPIHARSAWYRYPGWAMLMCHYLEREKRIA